LLNCLNVSGFHGLGKAGFVLAIGLANFVGVRYSTEEA
jgi:hypothetical protein